MIKNYVDFSLISTGTMESRGVSAFSGTKLISLDINIVTNHEVIGTNTCKVKKKDSSKGEEVKSKENNTSKWEDENDDQKLVNESIPHYYAWTGASGIVFALLNSCFIFCVWPQHNIFTEPSFWYEFMTVSVFGFIGLFSACFVLNCSIWMNLESIKTWKNFICLYFILV